MMKLLILSSNTGEGHNSAAAAIAAAAQAAGFSAKIRKPLEESTHLNRSAGSLYNTLLTHRPQWMGVYYGLIEHVRPNERYFFYSKVRAYIGRLLESEKPDVLLSVHPMSNHFIPRFIKEERLEIPCYTFLTDPFPPFWRGWASPYVDRYFVPTDEALQALTAMGIPAWRIEKAPMPVRSHFAPATMTELQQFRSTLELDGSNTILINGGARGGGPVFKIYQTIRNATESSNVIVVCGRNDRLRQRIEAQGHPRTRTFGFVEDIYRHVAASDLVVTKPGALSTYEALACKVPVLLVGIGGPMPQETGLFHAAAHYDFGFAVSTYSELAQVVQSGPSEWNRKREALPDFYRASSGVELVERIQPVYVRA